MTLSCFSILLISFALHTHRTHHQLSSRTRVQLLSCLPAACGASHRPPGPRAPTCCARSSAAAARALSCSPQAPARCCACSLSICVSPYRRPPETIFGSWISAHYCFGSWNSAHYCFTFPTAPPQKNDFGLRHRVRRVDLCLLVLAARVKFQGAAWWACLPVTASLVGFGPDVDALEYSTEYLVCGVGGVRPCL